MISNMNMIMCTTLYHLNSSHLNALAFQTKFFSIFFFLYLVFFFLFFYIFYLLNQKLNSLLVEKYFLFSFVVENSINRHYRMIFNIFYLHFQFFFLSFVFFFCFGSFYITEYYYLQNEKKKKSSIKIQPIYLTKMNNY